MQGRGGHCGRHPSAGQHAAAWGSPLAGGRASRSSLVDTRSTHFRYAGGGTVGLAGARLSQAATTISHCAWIRLLAALSSTIGTSTARAAATAIESSWCVLNIGQAPNHKG